MAMKLVSRLLAFPLLALAAVACGPGADRGTDADIMLLVTGEGLHLGVSNGSVRVVRAADGVPESGPVSDAAVTVNGTPFMFQVGSGTYTGQTGTAAGPGDVITVNVQAGSLSVTGTATVPEVVMQTGPANGTQADPAGTVDLEWALADDPDRYSLWVNAPGFSRIIAVPDGSLRRFTLNGTEFPAGLPLRVMIRAVEDGQFTGPVHEDSSLGAMSSPLIRDLPAFSFGPPAPTGFSIYGSDMGGRWNNVHIHDVYGTATDNFGGPASATVTLNGQPMTEHSPGMYRLELSPAVPPGGTLELRVAGSGIEAVATGVVPMLPVITAPADLTAYSGTDDIQVTWASTGDPDNFMLTVSGGDFYTAVRDIPGPERSHVFTAGEIPANSDPAVPYSVTLLAYTEGTFTGQYAETSAMNIRTETFTQHRFTVGP